MSKSPRPFQLMFTSKLPVIVLPCLVLCIIFVMGTGCAVNTHPATVYGEVAKAETPALNEDINTHPQPISPSTPQLTSTSAPLPADIATDPPNIPQAAPLVDPNFGEPAGCLISVDQAGRSASGMLSYAEKLVYLSTPLSKRLLPKAWNASQDEFLPTGNDVLAISVENIPEKYKIQEIMNALHVAGFVTWLRDEPDVEEHILAIPLNNPQILSSPWQSYISAYWKDGAAVPEKDKGIIPTLKLTPCQWMVKAGFAPSMPVGFLEAVSWEQPDFAHIGQAYLAGNTQEALKVAQRINYLIDTGTESPDLMCGPLTWAIQNDANAFPPGFGSWQDNPKSFWLPQPKRDGRPWNLFPSWSYQLTRKPMLIRTFDFNQFPLYPGDMLYLYSQGKGFDHVLTVTKVDDQNNVYSVTNLEQIHPFHEVSIQDRIIYNPADQKVGLFRNEWVNSPNFGQTGNKGFDVFRWAWRQKDISGQSAVYTIQVGDTLPLVAAKWKTPPDLIASANSLNPGSKLSIGQYLVIPPNTQ